MLWDHIGSFRGVGSLQPMLMPTDWAGTEQRKKWGSQKCIRVPSGYFKTLIFI